MSEFTEKDYILYRARELKDLNEYCLTCSFKKDCHICATFDRRLELEKILISFINKIYKEERVVNE